MILLTLEKEEAVLQVARKVSFPLEDLFVTSVSHSKVPDYLSDSEFAFSLHYPSSSMKYVSPINNGEYWAVGLPVITQDGIGDISSIIKETKTGSLIGIDNQENSFESINNILFQPSHRSAISELAVDNRSFQRIRDAYESIVRKSKL